MTSQARQQSEQGVSLIETIIALLVVMVGALGVGGLFLFVVKYNTLSGERALANAVAQQHMERLRDSAITDAPLLQTSAAGTSESVTNGGRTFDIVTKINDVSATLKMITVQITPVGNSAGQAPLPPITLTSLRAVPSGGSYLQ